MRTQDLRVPILCFHRVVPEGMEDCVWTLGLKQFERQIQGLAARGYQTISLSDLCRWQSQQAGLPSKPLILTFDDGQEGFLDRLAPILSQYRFRAALFLIAGMLGKEVHLEGGPPFRVMAPKEVAALAAAGFEIQSHGLYHRDWTRIEEEELREELTEPVRILEDLTRRPVQFLAYPYGRWTVRVRELVESAGFWGACTTDPGTNALHQNRFLLRRNMVLCRKGRWLFPWAVNRAREIHARLFETQGEGQKEP